MVLQTAPNKPSGSPASPAITALSLSDWTEQKLEIQSAFEREIYGAMPRNFNSEEIDRKFISDDAFSGSAIIEEIRIHNASPENDTGSKLVEFNMVLVTPKNPIGPVPVIMIESFCPNHSVIPNASISRPNGHYFNCDGEGILANIFGYFFGRYITTPPIEMIMSRGYAIAAIYPHETYPDSPASAPDYLRSAPNPDNPWGAVATWAYQFSLLANYLDQESQFSELIAYGHSRFGKSALLAAAFDPVIDGVIAHQSGTGGASLSRDKPGETVADITSGYPHWFTPGYAENKLTIDQHHLLALIAPRPVLLGNAKRDVWSDPNGAFRAAQGADPVYELYGSSGLSQDRLNKINPNADIAFWMRPGTHGVVEEDWPAFLAFLDAHFKN